MAYLKSLGTTFVWISTILAVITFLPGLPPNVDFSPYSFKLPTALDKRPNDNLNNAEKLFENEIKGPEAFDIYEGVLYTTLHGGVVSKLVGNKLVDVVKFGEKCDGLWEEEKCGRPLGMKFDKKGKLYVIDAYYGIFKVDVKTGKYEKIIDTSLPIEEKVPMFPNSIDVTDNGDLYWTISSSEFKLFDGMMALMCNPGGRLMRYNAATKHNEVLLENLAFPNGLKLSDDQSFVIIAETSTSRVIKYNLKGPKAGTTEIFIEGLPGLPDNIHTDGQGNFFVSLISNVDDENPQLTQSLSVHHNIRKMFVRLMVLLEAPLKFLDEAYPNYYAKRIVHWLGHFESASSIINPVFSILRIDPTGKVLDYLSVSDGKIGAISSAMIHDNYLYLGSPFNNYLARVPLDKALPEFKKKLEREPQVMEQIPKPLVEEQPTPKPTVVPLSTVRPPPPPPPPTTTTSKLSTPPTTAAPTAPPTTSTPIPPTVQTPKATVTPMEKPVVPNTLEKPVVSKPVEKTHSLPEAKKQVIRDEM